MLPEHKVCRRLCTSGPRTCTVATRSVGIDHATSKFEKSFVETSLKKLNTEFEYAFKPSHHRQARRSDFKNIKCESAFMK